MEHTEILDFLKHDILASYRVHFLELTASSDYLSNIDFQFRAQLIEGFDYKDLFFCMTRDITSEDPIEYIDGFGLHYMILEYGMNDQNEKKYIFMGPFLYQKYTDTDLIELTQRMHIPVGVMSDVKSFFQRITIIQDMLPWQFMIVRVMTRLLGHTVSFKMIDTRMSDTPKNIDATEFTPNSVVAFASIEARYKVEEGLIKAVTVGNVQDALYYYNMFHGFTLEPRCVDELRNGKDMVIAVNTFLRKAVQAAYVHPLYIDDLNQKLTRDIEACTSDMQLKNLCATMIRKYCLLVKTYSRAQYSEIIRDCLNYIDFHYQETLSLEMLAEKFIVSKSYLSSLFHKEVEMTLTDYINTTRVRRSLLLLNTTPLSIQDIAEQCGFSDGNYFTRTFKKFQGTSPLKYRQALQKEN